MAEHLPQAQDNEPVNSTPETFGALPIDRLPESLGFVETKEMSDLHDSYVAARLSGEVDVAHEIATQYHLLGQQVVEQHEDEAYARAQVGLTISLALLRRNAGVTDAYIDDLNDAVDYAGNMGYGDIVNSLEAAKSSAVADILRDIGEEYGFDPETCDEIAAQPFDEALEAAYGYLMQAGLDPDMLLESVMES